MQKVFIQTMKHKGVWQGENDKFNIADELFWVVVNVGAAITTLWMHLIPVVGTLLYCAVNGGVSRPPSHRSPRPPPPSKRLADARAMSTHSTAVHLCG
jgi:hypothetical protein